MILTEFVYIYALIDPITLEVRYIGRTKDLKKRYWGHLTPSSQYKSHKCNWFKSLKKVNLKPIMQIIDIVSLEECLNKEIYYIMLFKEKGCNLTNGNNGGGTIENVESLKERLKVYNPMVTDEARKKAVNSRKNKNKNWHSKETIEKIKSGNKGKKRSKESIERQVKSMTGRTYTRKESVNEKFYKPIFKHNLNKEIIKEYKSQKEAKQELFEIYNFKGSLYKALRSGLQTTCCNYYWSFKDMMNNKSEQQGI